jgi:hypothetical protein
MLEQPTNGQPGYSSGHWVNSSPKVKCGSLGVNPLGKNLSSYGNSLKGEETLLANSKLFFSKLPITITLGGVFHRTGYKIGD